MKDASCQGDAKLEIEVGSCRRITRKNASQPGGPRGPADIYICIYVLNHGCVMCAVGRAAQQ